jgi:hypothetical protein
VWWACYGIVFLSAKKTDRMKSSSIYLIIIALLVLGGVALSRCGGSDHKVRTASDSTTTPIGPAPDNNSANNPSLADTAYEKDRTRPITDTMPNNKTIPDTVKKRRPTDRH